MKLNNVKATTIRKAKKDYYLFVCLFELMLNVTVNSFGHVGTLPPFNRILPKIRNHDI